MQCKAKSRKGTQCKNSAMPGKEVCKFHGGMTPGGVASPHFKHGRYSKYLPSHLLEKYNAARTDPDLLNLRDGIALLEMRLQQLIEKLPEGGASHSWLDLRDAWEAFMQAQRQAASARTEEQRAQLETRAAQALQALQKIIDEGARESSVWQGIIETMENRRKLTASEAKRLNDMQQMITSERAITLVYAVLGIIKNNVTDRKTLSTISSEIRALITVEPQ